MSGFEGSFLGANDKISPAAIMECKICWTPYDPAVGDEYRQVEPGTSFLDLPGDWSCPNCSAPKAQFMVLEDPGAPDLADLAAITARTNRLVADFREIWHAKMRDVPLVNKQLSVEAVGFRRHEGGLLGVLVAPWFMNLILLPAETEDWSGLRPGEKEEINFASGTYEFLHNTRGQTGGYKACSLFSPMAEFRSQAQAVEVARAVMQALFDPEVRAETDRAVDIRARREAEMAAAAEPPTPEPVTAPIAPTRRTLISAGLAANPESAA